MLETIKKTLGMKTEAISEKPETPSSHEPCCHYGHPYQPYFDLIAQDLSAEVTVLFWAEVNALLQGAIAQGQNPHFVIDGIKAGIPAMTAGHKRYTHKIAGAQTTAKAMGKWTPRKVAD